MQSLRQYRQLRRTIAAQVNQGLVTNHPVNKGSCLDDPSNDTASSKFTRESWSAKGDEGSGEEANDNIIVGWEGPRDPLNPRNWPLSRRCVIFTILWINVFAVDWAAGADSQANKDIAKMFHVSEEAETLSPSMYTFGLATGSIFAGPIAETVGRNPVYVVSRILHVCWLIGVALAPNFGAQIVLRYLAGFSGSVLLAIHAASTADLFGPVYRTIAWPVIALASFWGTAFAPLVGAWIIQEKVWWRWTEWIAVILSGSTLLLTLFFLPETFSPILLSWRAKHLRDLTGCPRFKSELDLQASFPNRLRIAFGRAIHMITREPIVVCLGSWIVLEYFAVYGFLQGFKYVFGEVHGFSTGLTGTCWCAIALGCAIWSLGVPLYYRSYRRRVAHLHEGLAGSRRNSLAHRANLPGTDLPDPEFRLWQAVLAAPAFPIALFWLGWTAYPSISPWVGLVAVVLLGFSWAGIYVTVYQYLLDTYGIYAGSALAIITCWRYLVSGLVSLVSRPMYQHLGVHWVLTLSGCIAVLQLPLPLLFYFYGPAIRKRSQFAGRYARTEHERSRTGEALNWR